MAGKLELKVASGPLAGKSFAVPPGGLRLGRCTVEFVGQDNVGEDGTFDELELSRLIQDLRSYDVGRHQVGSELDTAETQA